MSQEFLLVFRNETNKVNEPVSPEQIQAMMKPWQDWIGSIAAQNKLSSSGNRLTPEGRVLKPGNIITDGPYVEIKEAIGGYIIVKADSYEEVVQLSKDCPILKAGGNVEIRQIVPMD